jgi:hypothetical protein
MNMTNLNIKGVPLPSDEATTPTITFSTSSDTALATATARNICFNDCKELLVRGGKISHWRVNGTASGSVEIDPPEGTPYEIHLTPGAAIQSKYLPDGMVVIFAPSQVIAVLSLDDSQELTVVYQDSSTTKALS